MELYRHCHEIGKDPIIRIAQLIMLLEPIIVRQTFFLLIITCMENFQTYFFQTVDIMMKQFFCVLTSQTQNVLEKNSQKLIEMVERLKI